MFLSNIELERKQLVLARQAVVLTDLNPPPVLVKTSLSLQEPCDPAPLAVFSLFHVFQSPLASGGRPAGGSAGEFGSLLNVF